MSFQQMPQTDQDSFDDFIDIQPTLDLIRHHDPVYTGCLFAMHWPQRPLLVPVPLKSTVQLQHGVNDLDIDRWVPKHLHRYIDHFPVTGTPLPVGYSLFYENQYSDAEVNLTVSKMFARGLRGNVFVVKHDDRDHVTDMSDDDLPIVQELIQQVLEAFVIGNSRLSEAYMSQWSRQWDD